MPHAPPRFADVPGSQPSADRPAVPQDKPAEEGVQQRNNGKVTVSVPRLSMHAFNPDPRLIARQLFG